MIELKNLKKTYKSKKGLSTEALKGINLKFKETGITFILGKSGSGKSTLLNILGGLDTYTSGDIIVNGKSTKKFKEKDWDAYRNTYIGFVFQEFNLLDNYNVYENIKISLELQNKKCTKKEIEEILKQVDLEDVLKRKPNELSGGQKQRIAIARALIKNPEIILADEPTGNLDSSNSEQIFKLLKKLSKNKLVVIVSHDEDAANKYADRIIRISDGIIESDNCKNIKEVDSEFKLVSAKLPFFYSFKMGLGNLFHKKFKLLFSLFLIILCLICFGTMISTLSPDIDKEYIKTFEEKGATEVYLTKYEKTIDYNYIFQEEVKNIFNMDDSFMDNLYPKTVLFDEGFLDEVNTKTNINWSAEYKAKNNFEDITWVYNRQANENSSLYYFWGETNYEISLIKIDNLKNDLSIIGNIPINDDEIVISSFRADQIIQEGIDSKKTKNSTTVDTYKPNSYEQIVNDDIYINFGDLTYVKIVGIVDYTEYLSKYNELKEVKTTTYRDMDIDSEEQEHLLELFSSLENDFSFLSRVYVSDSFIQKLALNEENMGSSTTKLMYNDKTYNIEYFGYLNKEEDIFVDNNIVKMSNLNSDEIIINTATLNLITNGDFANKLEEYLEDSEDKNTFIKKYIKDNNIISKVVKTSINKNKIYNDYTNFLEYKIVGVINDNKDYAITYYAKENIKDLLVDNLYINNVFAQIKTTDELKTVLEYYPINNSNIISSSTYSDELLTGMEFSVIFNYMGKYGTLFFLIFSILILMNFINTSIKFRKKEIGILRAIGCRSRDVIKIFVYECLFIMIFCLTITSIIIPKITTAINKLISLTLVPNMEIFKFGLVQMIGISIIMIIITILACIIPIRKLTKMKPIDIILNK